MRFVTLGSNGDVGAQAAWLDEVLDHDPQPWTVVVFHHPVFAATVDRNNVALRGAWLPVPQEHGAERVAAAGGTAVCQAVRVTPERLCHEAPSTARCSTPSSSGAEGAGAAQPADQFIFRQPERGGPSRGRACWP